MLSLVAYAKDKMIGWKVVEREFEIFYEYKNSEELEVKMKISILRYQNEILV